jgi:hypothetical protein
MSTSISDGDYEVALQFAEATEASSRMFIELKDPYIQYFYSGRASEFDLIAIVRFYLGFPDLAIANGRQAILAAHEHLYGDWQKTIPSGDRHNEPPSVEYWRKYQTWDTAVHAGFLWSLALHEWNAVMPFADYIKDDICLCVSQSKQERAWYIILAGAWKDRNWDELLPWRTLIESSRDRKHRSLLTCLESMMAGESAQAGEAFEDYIFRFSKTDFRSGDMSQKMSRDGSILVNLAKYKGWKLPVSPKAKPFLIEFP